jgi:DNA polymerase III alpha subunit
MGKAKRDDQRLRYTPELYVKSPEQMSEIFSRPEFGEAGREALANTRAIADRCNVELRMGANHAPMVRVRRPAPEDLPQPGDQEFGGDLTAWFERVCAQFELEPFDHAPTQAELAEAKTACDMGLRQLANAGLVWRYGPNVHDSGETLHKEACARLNRELRILEEKGISAYFLIVWDFVNWGRQRDIPAMARGSGVGTMVGYVLGLSNACPVRYGLLFERFTDPNRSEYPDIDIDLCQDGRASVISYVREKYGHVAQIITFGTLKARAAIRDIGRVLETPLSAVDRLAKMIPEQVGMTLDKAMEAEPDLRELYEGKPAGIKRFNDHLKGAASVEPGHIRTLIDTAKRLEGQARHAGVHAAGVIVATRPLDEIVPLYKATNSGENEVVTQWDGPTCEKMGLLKMDFLGLRTLSTIERCKRLIRESLSEEAVWKAVGRLGEWQSDKVAEWQSGEEEGQKGDRHPESASQTMDGATNGSNTNISRSRGVAERDGPGKSDLPSHGDDATTGNLRPDQSDAPGRDVSSTEHLGGIRKAHTGRVPPRTARVDGVVVRVDDGLRAGDQPQHDQAGADCAGHAGRRGPGPGSADPEPRTKEGSEAQGQSLDGDTLSLSHSVTLPLSSPLSAHPLDLDRLTFDDERVFALFARGDTTGVFQFESGGMRRLLQEMKPDRLEDLIAANALFRPGPMDLIPDYNRRKHGTEPVPKVHPIVDKHTAETYAVMVYQEQVMQIVHELGDLDLRDAYTLIKAISKKKKDKIDAARPDFIQAAGNKGLSKREAEDLFELILKFAGYGFNKSHSTAYAIVAYQTAYLKTYFPNHYMAAFLTFESRAQKVADWIPYLEDCKHTRFVNGKVGVEVRPPDINLSRSDFTVVYADDETPDALSGHVRFGLAGIKGVSWKAVDVFVEEREKNGPFKGLFDFCERVPGGVVNKATIEALIRCGAFDALHGREQRAAMFASIERAISIGQKAVADRMAGQSSLFGAEAGAPAPVQEPALESVEPWSEAETLTQEKEALGFYVSSHPLEEWRDWARVFARDELASLRSRKQDDRVRVAAILSSVRPIVVKSGRSAGQKMAILTIEDLTGNAEAVLFADRYTSYAHLLDDDAPKFILGRLDLSRGDPQIIVDQIAPIDGTPLEGGRLDLWLNLDRIGSSATDAAGSLRDLLASHVVEASDWDDACFNYVVHLMYNGVEYEARPEDGLKLRLDNELAHRLRELFGADCIRHIGGVLVEMDEDKRRARFRR